MAPGPHGAGLPAALNRITRFPHCTAGTILFNGFATTGEHAAGIARRGIVREPAVRVGRR